MRHRRGGGKFEFLLVVALFGVLAFALLNRLADVEQEAERTEVSLTERNIRVGLLLAVGEDVMGGREDRLAELLAANPVQFLGRTPRGYLGETGLPGGPGTWRFDPATRVLAYRPRQAEAFGGRQELRWRIQSRVLPDGRVAGIRLENLSD